MFSNIFQILQAYSLFSNPVWSWVCNGDICTKVDANSSTSAVQLSTCKLTCGKYGSLWPKPTGAIQLGNQTLRFLPKVLRKPTIYCKSSACEDETGQIKNAITSSINKAFSTFEKNIKNVYDKQRVNKLCNESLLTQIKTDLEIRHDDLKQTLTTNESYQLSITTSKEDQGKKDLRVKIRAESFFGVRHALETVSQLTSYSEESDTMQIVSEVNISDAPIYPYRGLMLDTSRNFFSVKSLMDTVRAMSYNKMNTLHWHITDTPSFPIEIMSLPNMTKYGAYSDRQIYTKADVKRIIEYSRLHGVRVLPEFDQPAHCGNGWQWGKEAGLGELAVCVNKDPWEEFCVEPPCGQLNPANDKLYPILEKIYKEYLNMFDSDLFHAGGDEVKTYFVKNVLNLLLLINVNNETNLQVLLIYFDRDLPG